MTRLSQYLLLAAALATITFVVTRSLQLPPSQVLVLLAGGVLAQGFAAWRPTERKYQGFARPRRGRRILVSVVRAVFGCAALAALVAGALWALPATATLPWLGL